MIKTDYKKELRQLYQPTGQEITEMDIPPLNFVMIDGSSDPNKSQEYQAAIEALYAVSYGIKFAIKKEQETDYGVMPLEGLWWTDDMSTFSITNKDNWKWTAMIMQPRLVTCDMFETVRRQVEKKKGLPSLSRIRFENFQEGRSAQILYVGPFSAEGPAIAGIHEYIKNQGCSFDGLVQKHHEIYLNDFRKTAPEKLKTIIRQPFRSTLNE